MGQVDPLSIGELETATERARKALTQKITKQKTTRYYRTANNRNFGERQNLGFQLKTISNEEHEFERAFSAKQRVFKISRRRHIESLEHVKVGTEIKNLQEKRRQSTMLSKLTITQDLEDAAKKITNPRDSIPTDVIQGTPLPKNVSAALHEGVPTILSRPKIIKRIKTAPAGGRHYNSLPSMVNVSISDPLRMLERVETSDGFIHVRNRLARKASAIVATSSSQHKTAASFPDYLALDHLEAMHIRATVRQQAVDRCKSLHAGNDERCSSMVQQWLQELHVNQSS